MIDTNQAAHSAAAFLAARVKPSQGGASAKQESVHFQKLKAGLGQSPLSANSPVGGSLKSGKPTKGPGFTQQIGHNQTFGANASRTGVPRRTSGG
ncbi:MAG: hypothetical protein H7144_11980 [Burkholderiales bacterium]|nr:hypothetical protein [Phycisphaerae bacterium]